MSDDREARIRERAYHIWVEQGRPEGGEHDHWLKAQREIDREQQAGYEMLEVDGKEAIGKPDHDSVVPDQRPLEEPANKSDEPVPMHAEKEAAHAGSALTDVGRTASAAAGKGKGKARPDLERPKGTNKTSTAKSDQAVAAPRTRKTKAKSSSMESL